MITHKHKDAMVRFGARIREDQFKFVKDYAKKNGLTDGEATRCIFDIAMDKNKNTKTK